MFDISCESTENRLNEKSRMSSAAIFLGVLTLSTHLNILAKGILKYFSFSKKTGFDNYSCKKYINDFYSPIFNVTYTLYWTDSPEKIE